MRDREAFVKIMTPQLLWSVRPHTPHSKPLEHLVMLRNEITNNSKQNINERRIDHG